MPQQPQYLSTDPNAGTPVAAGGYLSTDPNAGEPVKADAPEQEKSVSGFLGNLVSSTGRLVKDSASGLVDAAKFFHQNNPLNPDKSQMMDPQQALRIMRALPGAVAEGVSNGYGSLEKAGETLCNDPAGVLADVSAVFRLGAGAAAKAPRIAHVLRGAESAIKPLRGAEPAAK